MGRDRVPMAAASATRWSGGGGVQGFKGVLNNTHAKVNDRIAKSMTRVLKVANFYGVGGRSWQHGISVVVMTIIDKLHWQILGRAPKKTHRALGKRTSLISLLLKRVTLRWCCTNFNWLRQHGQTVANGNVYRIIAYQVSRMLSR